jgi:hypothetical protein
MKKKFLVLMIFVLLLMTTVEALGIEKYKWNEPYLVTVDPKQTHGFDPAIVQTEEGKFYVLMSGIVNNVWGMYLSSSNDGKKWDTPSYLFGGWDESDIIQGQDNYLYAAISKYGGVEIWRSLDGEMWTFWGQVVRGGNGDINYFVGSITQRANGKFYCVFQADDGTIYVSSSDDAALWSEKLLINTTGFWDFDPSIAEVDGKLYVVYNSYWSKEIWITSSIDGINWSPPTQITKNAWTGAHSGPSITEGADKTIAVTYATVSSGVRVLESKDGTSWTEIQAISCRAQTPSIIKDKDNRLWIVYAEYVNGWKVYVIVGVPPKGPEISVEKEFIPSEITTMSQEVVSAINITNIGDVDITSMTVMDEHVENMAPNESPEVLVTITSDEGDVYAIMPENLTVVPTENNITISLELPLWGVLIFWENNTLQSGEELYYLESIPKNWIVGVQYSLYPTNELEVGTHYADATVTAYSKTGESTTETTTGMLIVSEPVEIVPSRVLTRKNSIEYKRNQIHFCR